MTSIPQIQIGKTHSESFHVKHMLPLPADTPFGNLALKYMSIIQRLDFVDVMMQTVYQSFGRARTQNFSKDIFLTTPCFQSKSSTGFEKQSMI